MKKEELQYNINATYEIIGGIIRYAILDFISRDLLEEPGIIKNSYVTGYPRYLLEDAIVDRIDSAAFFTDKHSMFKYFDLDARSLIKEMIDIKLKELEEDDVDYKMFLIWQKEQLKYDDWYKIDPPHVKWYKEVFVPNYWKEMKGDNNGKEKKIQTHESLLGKEESTEVLQRISGLLE